MTASSNPAPVAEILMHDAPAVAGRLADLSKGDRPGSVLRDQGHRRIQHPPFRVSAALFLRPPDRGRTCRWPLLASLHAYIQAKPLVARSPKCPLKEASRRPCWPYFARTTRSTVAPAGG